MKKYILIFLLFSPVVFADIFKCKNESGITAFQSQPCDKNVKQEVIKTKRRYRDVTDANVLSFKDLNIMFDDVMAGDEHATKLYIKYLKEHGDELFKEEEPVSEEVIQRRRLQRSIDEQNRLLREQSIMQQQSNFERDESLRKQERALRKLKRQQEEALRELNRKQQESIYKDEQRKQEEDNQRFYDKQKQDERDFSIQQRLDDIEYGIRGY